MSWGDWEVQDPVTGAIISILAKSGELASGFFSGGGWIIALFLIPVFVMILALIVTIGIFLLGFFGWWKIILKILRHPIPVFIFLIVAVATLIWMFNSSGLDGGEFFKSFFWAGDWGFGGLVVPQLIWFFSPWIFLSITALAEKIAERISLP
ncbi:MAG: hypothetical protein A3A08_01635 [Candidatus Nealsonbacteria bacterium RIFCSPLOWO2_01_FULL_41_9]|uniref:Uncharacterized protein n=1 Tax=Candidatus Nealsonbacteria bacterium RIFCSPLOWO2_01_FULL_41_9 TaxID=1801671 RepID=A0A1G2EE03_9BACT|nr:MAG: hypothetical protein A3A08_01635 [Candidatus Nealsonbacteria bacterium RIFCSPLOWO2_01_FULL_41_9]